jgi:hypothetical protein
MTDQAARPLWRYYLREMLDHWHYIAFGIVIGAFSFWMLTRPEATTDPEAAVACQELYGLARSAADTIRVDAIYPLGPVGKDAMPCGRLRALGMLK